MAVRLSVPCVKDRVGEAVSAQVKFIGLVTGVEGMVLAVLAEEGVPGHQSVELDRAAVADFFSAAGGSLEALRSRPCV